MEIRGGTRNNESMATGARRRGSNWLETQQKNVRVVHVFSTIGIDGGFAQPAPSAPPLPLLHRGKKNADWILSAGNSKPSGWLHLESIINFVVQPRPPPVNRRHVPQARRSLLVRRPLTWRDPQINRCTSDPQQSNQKKKINKEKRRRRREKRRKTENTRMKRCTRTAPRATVPPATVAAWRPFPSGANTKKKQNFVDLFVSEKREREGGGGGANGKKRRNALPFGFLERTSTSPENPVKTR